MFNASLNTNGPKKHLNNKSALLIIITNYEYNKVNPMVPQNSL